MLASFKTVRKANSASFSSKKNEWDLAYREIGMQSFNTQSIDLKWMKEREEKMAKTIIVYFLEKLLNLLVSMTSRSPL